MIPRILLTLLALSVVSCNKKDKAPKKEKNIIKTEIQNPFAVEFNKVNNEDKSKLIEAFYNDKINLDHFSGQFLVAKNGQVLFENSQGYSNYKSKEEITSTTALHLASISKVLTAAVVLRLVQDNKIALDDLLQKYFPNFPYKGISIRSLLNHRSGLPNYAYFTDNSEVWDKHKTLHNQDILVLFETQNIPLEAQPDTKFSYCNTNYALLALVIEKVTKLSYPKAMQEYLFTPLEMKNTFVFEMEKQKDTVSQSYKSTWEKIPYDYLDAIYGDKNIYSTATDLLKFDLATYSNKFFSKQLRKEIFKGYSYERPGVKNYGLGIRLNEWDNHDTLFYHNGWWHGNTTSYITLKKDTVTMIALSNKYNKKVYQLKKLSSVFGNYPFELEEE